MELLVTNGAGFEPASVVLIQARWEAGAPVQAYDREAMKESQHTYDSRDHLSLCGTKEAALKDAGALVIVTAWQEFRTPDFDFIKQALKEPVMFDGGNMYEPSRLSKRGFNYRSVGR